MLDLSGVGQFNPPLVPLNPPKFVLTHPKKKVKISRKYITDYPLVVPQIEYWGYVEVKNVEGKNGGDDDIIEGITNVSE